MSDQDAGTLLIGAKIDTGLLQSDLALTKEDIATFVESVNVEFSEMSTRTASAMARIGEDTKEAAATISSEWQRAAAASYEFATAQKEVRAATALVTATSGEDAAAVQLLAAAKQKAALASVELAAATKATAVAEEEEVGMAGAVAGAFETVEAAIAPLVAAGFLLHFINDTKESVLAMHDLAERTGFSIQTIAGLRYAAEAAGVPFEALTQSLGRMLRAQELSSQGNKGMIQALADIGLTVNQVKNLAPEQLFFTLAAAMERTESPAARVTASIALFGKGGQALIPLFEMYGSQLQDVARLHGQLSGVTDKSAESALSYQKTLAEFGEIWHSAVIPAMNAAGVAMGFIDKAIIRIDATTKSVFNELVSGWRNAVEIVSALGVAMEDVATGKFQKADDAMTAAMANVSIENYRAAEQSISIWKKASEQIHDINLAPKAPSGKTDTGASGDVVTDTRLQDWKLQLDQMRDAEDAFHQLSKADEAAFWKDKLAIAQGTPKLYAEVYHQFAEADRAAKQQSLKDEVQGVEASLQAYKQGSQERVTILQEEVTHIAAMGGQQTQEYKRLQEQLTAAEREAQEQRKQLQLKDAEDNVALFKNGTEQRVNAERQYVALAAQLYGQDSTQYKAALKSMEEAERSFQERKTKMELDARAFAGQMDILEVQQQKDAFEQEMALGLKSREQILAQEQAFAAQEHAIRAKALQDQIAEANANPDLNAQLLQKLHQELIAEDQKYQNEKLQIDRKYVTQRMALEQSLQGSLRSSFSGAISGMLTNTQSLAQSLKQLYSGIAGAFANMLADQLTRWIANNILMKAFGLQQQTTSNAEELAQNKVKTEAEVTMAAGVAGANAVASYALAPWPLDMGAPAFGAAMEATAMSFGQFEKGGIIPETGPIFGHAKEMVLPSHISQGLQEMIGSGRSGGTNSTTHNHNSISYSGGNVNAIDGRGLGAALKSSRSEVVKTMQKFVRSGHMSPRKLGLK